MASTMLPKLMISERPNKQPISTSGGGSVGELQEGSFPVPFPCSEQKSKELHVSQPDGLGL